MGSIARAASRRSTFHDELHRLRRSLFAANQSLINQAIKGSSENFRRYEARYQSTVNRARGPSSYGALLDAVSRARVVLVGDYHTFAPSQRSFQRLLEAQAGELVIALEMLPGDEQPMIDRFLAGDLREATFLRRIDLAHRWPFGGFEIVRPIFELARQRGWPVIGLDRPGISLAERDRYAAERIASALHGRPNARVCALIGECHLAPKHLPRSLERAFEARQIELRTVRVHQNPEAIWFDLDARGLAEEHDVLEVGDGAFALLTASPLVCQQSFLTWLERVDDGEDPAAFEDPDSGERLVRQALSVIGRALGLPVRGTAARLEVVGPGDLSFFERLADSGAFDRRELKLIRAHILSSESYYVPRASLIYLASLSLTHAAEEAVHALRHHLSGEGIDDPRLPLDAFYARVVNEALGFLGSKLVNPKRRCLHPDELAGLLAQKGELDPLERRAAELVLLHKELERGTPCPELSAAFTSSAELFNAVTHLLGYDLGDRLYHALIRGRLSSKEVRGLFYEPFDEDGAAMLLYFELAARVGRVRVPRGGSISAATGLPAAGTSARRPGPPRSDPDRP